MLVRVGVVMVVVVTVVVSGISGTGSSNSDKLGEDCTIDGAGNRFDSNGK